MQVVTAPTRYPVTISEAVAQLRIDANDDDMVIAGYLATATKLVEEWSGTSMMQRTYKLFLDAWPVMLGVIPRARPLQMPPLVSVTHIKTYNDSDVATVWSAASYFVDTANGRIGLRSGASWPIPDRLTNGIEIQFVAGYESAGDTPENLRHAILLTVAHWHRNREPVNIGNITSTLPFGVTDLIGISREWRF